MEVFLSAALGELTARSINFFISKCSKPTAPATEDSLQRVLLRAQVIINEAMGRHITNQAMLQQLDMLSDAIHQGYYMLDTFRYQSHDKEVAKDQIVSHSSVLLSKVYSVKDFCFSSGTSTQIRNEMQEVFDRLSSMISDANELVMILKSYTHLYRQPYSMHILLSNCMFGRQMETELVINFLLHTQSRRAGELEVLPIVGPGRVGKSTLVAHVCSDKRVLDHFSEIIVLRDHDFIDGKLSALREAWEVKHQICNSKRDGKFLVVVDVAGDLNEDAWKRFYSSKWCVTSGSKIIIASRSDKITKLGTTRALTLKYLSNEAFWYFFKTLTFGSTDPETHPRLTYLAMEIVKELDGSIIGANITACLLRDNFEIQFWLKLLAFLKGMIQKHVTKFGERPGDLLKQNRTAHLGRMFRSSEDFMVHDQYQCYSQEEVPKITFQDVMYGSIKPHGKFEVLAWKSQIPPYHNYIYTCEIRDLKTTAAKRKRSIRNGVSLS
ncbi:hypothetical protein ACP70R_015118 [Stipagrostis hirtigluma subsp. patula]